MMTQTADVAGEVVLSCTEIAETVAFFTDTLGFRIVSVFPADDPRAVRLSGFGLGIRLERDGRRDDSMLRLPGTGDETLCAPNGTRIRRGPAEPPLVVPPPQPALVITTAAGNAAWHTGRAGMQYRDLVPGRLGGHLIASHIRIPGRGPVPDYVHFHKVRFQLIFCRRGWVRVAYEDQGPPFVLEPGDCVLQPPEIRHRVLESGDDLEVVEVGSPAEHVTAVDHALSLPTDTLRPERTFSGQRFVRHRAANAAWATWRIPGFEARDTGIAAATGGIGSVVVARPAGVPERRFVRHDAPSLFLFVLAGRMRLELEGGRSEPLGPDDSAMLPPGLGYRLADCSPDLELREVAMPAGFATTPA